MLPAQELFCRAIPLEYGMKFECRCERNCCKEICMTGTLYITATPIGNLEDITPRALRILGSVSIIAAEDTRRSRRLLSNFGIKTPMFSCHKFNEGKRGDFFVSALLEGRDTALISDAGTPCISDPGHRLVRLAAEKKIPVVPVCGVSAVTAALSVSGFDASAFAFLGFLPRGNEAAKTLAGKTGVAVFYESPLRIEATLEMLETNFPEAEICLCNDISKKFERVYRGCASEILRELKENPNAKKGEYTCVTNLPEIVTKIEEEAPSIESLLTDIIIKQGCNLKEASRILHEKNPQLAKKEIYSAMLNLKNIFGDKS